MFTLDFDHTLSKTFFVQIRLGCPVFTFVKFGAEQKFANKFFLWHCYFLSCDFWWLNWVHVCRHPVRRSTTHVRPYETYLKWSADCTVDQEVYGRI